MSKEEIYIVGAGTYGEVMHELAELLGYKIMGYYDESEEKLGKEIMRVKVLGKFSELNQNEINKRQFIVAIGNNSIRQKLMTKINKLGGRTPSLIHPTAVISPSAEIGKGVYIHANTHIWTKVKISDYCIISSNVVIAHHTKLGNACLVSTLAGIGASVNLEERCFVGMGSTIVTGVTKIGSDTTIGAGAVVLESLDSNCVYAGVPAKKLRSSI